MSSRLVPAGVPRNLAILKSKIAARLEHTPLFFFAVVIGIALTFRVAIGWARTATDQPVAEPAATTTTAPTTRVSRPVVRDDDGPTPTAAGAGTTVMPADTISGDSKPSGGIPKRKPRTHGRR